MKKDKVGDIIPIGDGSVYQLYCHNVTPYSSYWILQVFKHFKFLWWEWDRWKQFEFTRNYGAGDTTHIIELKRKGYTTEELVWQAEAELDFLGFDYD